MLESKHKYNVVIVFILHCETLLLLLRWDTGRLGPGLLVWVGLSKKKKRLTTRLIIVTLLYV